MTRYQLGSYEWDGREETAVEAALAKWRAIQDAIRPSDAHPCALCKTFEMADSWKSDCARCPLGGCGDGKPWQAVRESVEKMVSALAAIPEDWHKPRAPALQVGDWAKVVGPGDGKVVGRVGRIAYIGQEVAELEFPGFSDCWGPEGSHWHVGVVNLVRCEAPEETTLPELEQEYDGKMVPVRVHDTKEHPYDMGPDRWVHEYYEWSPDSHLANEICGGFLPSEKGGEWKDPAPETPEFKVGDRVRVRRTVCDNPIGSGIATVTEPDDRLFGRRTLEVKIDGYDCFNSIELADAELITEPPKKKRGGKRPGAGRPKKVFSNGDRVRVKKTASGLPGGAGVVIDSKHDFFGKPALIVLLDGKECYNFVFVKDAKRVRGKQ